MRPINLFQTFLSLLVGKGATSSSFSLNPYGEYDSYYEQSVRTALGTFHINLSHGKYSLNGPLVSPSIAWNVDGVLLISRSSFVTRLTGFNTTFHGLLVPDVYHIVDGHVGAVLYHLQGPQTGPFFGIPVSGNSIDILGAEVMNFNKDAELNELLSIEEFARAESQLLGKTPVPAPVTNLTSLLVPNPQTPPSFRSHIRTSLGKIHDNYNNGKNSENAKLVAHDVEINADWVITSGPQAFLDLISQWQGSFPDLVFHDNYVLADGHLGVVDFVWEGTQTKDYTLLNGTVLAPTGLTARARGVLFFEFADSGLISKVTEVQNEGFIEPQLEGGPLFP